MATVKIKNELSDSIVNTMKSWKTEGYIPEELIM